MVDYRKTKPSKNFKDRVTSYVPQLFAPPGTFKPTSQQANTGYETFLNPLFAKAISEWLAARKIQPGVEKYENFEQPGYSPDLEPFWDEKMKNKFRKVKKEYDGGN